MRRTRPTHGPGLAGLLGCAALLCAGAAAAQQPPQGTYNGELGPLTIQVHFTTAPDGSPTCTLDSPNQGARGIACADVQIEGERFSFRVPSVNGSWQGSIADAGATLRGTWSQGSSMPLVLARDSFVPAERPSAVDGFWLSTQTTQGVTLRNQLVVRSDNQGRQRCTLDVIELNVWDLNCTTANFSDGSFSFEIPTAGGRWQGTLSTDGDTLSGTWTPANAAAAAGPAPEAMAFTRLQQRIEPAPQQAVTFDAPIAPVDAETLEQVLRADLGDTLTTGLLAPGKNIGVTVGVITKNGRSVFTLGSAQADALFEIGSITKTFTGLAMAQLIEQRRLRADTTVRELLPAGTVAQPSGPEITLQDLVTQHSGLPRMPDNFAPADPANPYVDYSAERLLAFLAMHGVGKPASTSFLYSNVGFGLLGYALTLASGEDYAALIDRQVLQPLQMRETAITLPSALRGRFIQGHGAGGVPASSWELDALAGAGALRSTASDMLRYLEAQLDPERAAGEGSAATLPAALRRSHQPLAEVTANMRIAYGWLLESGTGTYWHSGGTGGFTAFAFFNPAEGHAGIVLVNAGQQPRGSLADHLGQHILQRLTGKPALSLTGW